MQRCRLRPGTLPLPAPPDRFHDKARRESNTSTLVSLQPRGQPESNVEDGGSDNRHPFNGPIDMLSNPFSSVLERPAVKRIYRAPDLSMGMTRSPRSPS